MRKLKKKSNISAESIKELEELVLRRLNGWRTIEEINSEKQTKKEKDVIQ